MVLNCNEGFNSFMSIHFISITLIYFPLIKPFSETAVYDVLSCFQPQKDYALLSTAPLEAMPNHVKRHPLQVGYLTHSSYYLPTRYYECLVLIVKRLSLGQGRQASLPLDPLDLLQIPCDQFPPEEKRFSSRWILNDPAG
ncbi:uncharacterized protein LACBIDRAFT_333685 [Laccaria bicolor S238N-H82]|uniref:Predicted protein n=1 Tax=Laccaria bicolor (strain S238N-H82 / ATCC MYA-4686) TaxID=486041 RepID=B0DWL5_LACBS|nr:uncharacterized protein LACBIDRAFT_333685 [Laccaria bicolor S238N-H82]EDR01001.1 predicted protein [Laccaria bicolor S238N-H82]|eukprot:XP_001888396.1 predicted protein [Laccaria bicolor S238N-H82]